MDYGENEYTVKEEKSQALVLPIHTLAYENCTFFIHSAREEMVTSALLLKFSPAAPHNPLI